VVTLQIFDEAMEQGYAPIARHDIRAARDVGGVTGLVDLVILEMK